MTAIEELKALRDMIRASLERIKEREDDALPTTSRREAAERRKLLEQIEADIREIEAQTRAKREGK